MSDREAVIDLVQTERAARDQGQWQRLAACYHPDSTVSISWIETSGPDFVEASKKAFAAGVRHLHQMGQTLVTLNGERALAESGCAILLGGRIGSVEVMVTSHCRLHVRAKRREGRWGIVSLRPVYFHDAIAARLPGEAPVIDTVRLARYRESYRFLSYLLEETGKTARSDLPGIDRQDLVDKMAAADTAWLGGT